MKSIEILNRFNLEGIFPTDKELQILAEESGEGETIIDVELSLLKVAEEDKNHPYHHMTQPIPESEKSESQKEFEKWIEESTKNI